MSQPAGTRPGKAAARWRSARTLADLGELAIAWLHGEINQTPGHNGPPDDETIPLIPALVIVNRGGFVTENSQLAGFDGDDTWNTWVSGFASDATLARLREAVGGTPLRLSACRGRVHECGQQRFRFPHCPRREVTRFWADACPAVASTLWDAWYVTVEDPEPGRNELLWTTLATALSN